MIAKRAFDYQSCMNDCGMIDLGFVGLKFTWSNKRGLADLIQVRQSLG